LPDKLESLCGQNSGCVAAFEESVLGLSAGTWILGLFLGMLWASASLALGRKGYTQSGKTLAVLGLGTLCFVALKLKAEGSCTPCTASMAGAALVAAGGFLGRQETEDPDRSFGAFLTAMALVLISTGALAQARALTQPWSDLREAPALSGREAVLDGSASASKNKVVLFADFSDRLSDKALAALLQINKDHENAIRLLFKPLATENGMPISMGLHCAKQRGASRSFAKKMLMDRSQRDDAGVNALALRSGFKQAEFMACFEDEGARRKLSSDRLSAEKAGFEAPFSVAVETTEGWKKLDSSKSVSAQITALLGLQKAEN